MKTKKVFKDYLLNIIISQQEVAYCNKTINYFEITRAIPQIMRKQFASVLSLDTFVMRKLFSKTKLKISLDKT